MIKSPENEKMTTGFQPRSIFCRNAAVYLIENMEWIKIQWAQYFKELLNVKTFIYIFMTKLCQQIGTKVSFALFVKKATNFVRIIEGCR